MATSNANLGNSDTYNSHRQELTIELVVNAASGRHMRIGLWKVQLNSQCLAARSHPASHPCPRRRACVFLVAFILPSPFWNVTALLTGVSFLISFHLHYSLEPTYVRLPTMTFPYNIQACCPQHIAGVPADHRHSVAPMPTDNQIRVSFSPADLRSRFYCRPAPRHVTWLISSDALSHTSARSA